MRSSSFGSRRARVHQPTARETPVWRRLQWLLAVGRRRTTSRNTKKMSKVTSLLRSRLKPIRGLCVAMNGGYGWSGMTTTFDPRSGFDVKERPTTGLRAPRARPPMRLAGTLRDSVPHGAEQWSGPCNGHPANSLILGCLVLCQRILIPPFPGSNPGAPASVSGL